VQDFGGDRAEQDSHAVLLEGSDVGGLEAKLFSILRNAEVELEDDEDDRLRQGTSD
jgi:hypothetical protein